METFACDSLETLARHSSELLARHSLERVVWLLRKVGLGMQASLLTHLSFQVAQGPLVRGALQIERDHPFFAELLRQGVSGCYRGKGIFRFLCHKRG